MKLRSRIFIVLLTSFAFVFYWHDFRPPKTQTIKIWRGSSWSASIYKIKDGGSLVLRLEYLDGREEQLYLDRRLIRSQSSSNLSPTTDSLLYLGYENLLGYKALDCLSPVGQDIEQLVNFENSRWLVQIGFYDYRSTLEEFKEAVGRTKSKAP